MIETRTNDRRRVVVTGVAAVTALGTDLATTWSALLAGEVGLALLPEWAADYPAKIGGLVSDDALGAALRRASVSDRDRVVQFALLAVGDALRSAGLPDDGQDALEHHLIVGSGHGSILFHHEAHRAFIERGYRRLRPTTVVRLMFNRVTNVVSARYRLCGESATIAAACASGALAFGDAYRRVRAGTCEVAIAACADAGLDAATVGAWNRLGALSDAEDPATASRPFDRGRRGLVMGEGAAAFVLETETSARARGRPVFAEVLGYGGSTDAMNAVQPDPEGQARAVRAALADAAVTPDRIDYVCLHGTGAEAADRAEAEGLKLALGAYAVEIPASSVKAQLGHLMGASSGVETAITIEALRQGRIPPCRNLDDPDPSAGLNFARETDTGAPRIALKNAFAFGGINAAIVLARPGGQ